MKTAVLLLALIPALGFGCASIVRKPEVTHIRKVAIVSMYAHGLVPWTGGPGKIENFGTETKQRVALDAYKAFSEEFRRLGWTVVPLEQVSNNALYKKSFGPQQADANSNVLAKAVNYLGDLDNARFFTAPGIFPIEWSNEREQGGGLRLDLASFKIESKRDFKDRLVDLATELGVDAVALIELDYCYTGATAVLGNGTAKLSAGSRVRMMNRDKVLAVEMKPSQKRCDGPRGESAKTVAMVGGSISLGRTFAIDTLTDAFIEASRASAKLTVDQIQEAIAK